MTSGIKLKPSLETVDVVQVVNWVKMCVARTGTSRQVAIIAEPFPTELCRCIITDRQWLMENLLCLISNAQKFTARGDIRVKYSSISVNDTSAYSIDCDDEISRDGISLSVVSPTNSTRGQNMSKSMLYQESKPTSLPMIMVEVIDSGIGISEEMQQSLFKPFKQAMRRAGGTGLGIYSLSKRVESLGGTCGVSSRSDGKNRARFWFTLPYRPDVTAVSPPSSPQAHSDLHHPPFSEEVRESPSHDALELESYFMDDNVAHIMLVEDSPLIQKTCARSFLREGIAVDIASDGLECVEKVLASPNRYEVLLMDVNMPLMDGLEATERIRQWERGSCVVGDIESNTTREVQEKKLIIIGVSANSDAQSKQEALDAGMDGFISKPLKISNFVACMTDFGLDLDKFRR